MQGEVLMEEKAVGEAGGAENGDEVARACREKSDLPGPVGELDALHDGGAIAVGELGSIGARRAFADSGDDFLDGTFQRVSEEEAAALELRETSFFTLPFPRGDAHAGEQLVEQDAGQAGARGAVLRGMVEVVFEERRRGFSQEEERNMDGAEAAGELEAAQARSDVLIRGGHAAAVANATGRRGGFTRSAIRQWSTPG